jgi:hypothetical protein
MLNVGEEEEGGRGRRRGVESGIKVTKKTKRE